jgi:hypothetical protein
MGFLVSVPFFVGSRRQTHHRAAAFSSDGTFSG